MIKFRTEVEIPEFRNKVGYHHQSIMFGSCFAENIGYYLQELCFPVIVNPFGILYNPVSIANSLDNLMKEKKFNEHDLFYSNGLYNSFLHHSRFSCSDKVDTLDQINTQATLASNALKDSSHLFITFGTAWVFKHIMSGNVVSNCHKLPSATFERYRLTVSQITQIWIPLVEQLRNVNPKLSIVFTVSPIRHLKDGAHENQLSKSTLLLAIEELISIFGKDSISYFPSYELVLDELRDYRFYASDMTHLSDTAIDFVREKFLMTILDEEAKTVSAELEKIVQALRHKPLNINEISYISFIENQIKKTHEIQNNYPFIDLKKVIKKFIEKKAE